jgi:hypothetical protein
MTQAQLDPRCQLRSKSTSRSWEASSPALSPVRRSSAVWLSPKTTCRVPALSTSSPIFVRRFARADLRALSPRKRHRERRP